MPFSAADISALVAYAATHMVVTLAGVWVTYYLMCQVFPRRHAPYLWFCYFIVKGFVHGVATLGVDLGGGASFELLVAIETSVTSVLSMLVVFYTWRGDLVELAVCAVTSDMFSGVFAVLTRMLANALLGYPLDQGWTFMTLPSAALDAVLRVLAVFALRRPCVGILHFVRRAAMQHHLAGSLVVAAFLVFSVAEISMIPSYQTLRVHHTFMELPILLVLVWTSILVARRAYDVSRREEALNSCVQLAGDYDRKVRTRLATLDEERGALDGHERSLARLGASVEDADLALRIRSLEHTYRMLCSGNYCGQPALDAVLTAGSRRLREVGVSCDVTVAGLSVSSVGPAMMAHALLGLAAEAAERSRSGGDGATVELRVRGVGSSVLLHLDVPASWGRLRARHLLAPYCGEGAHFVSERRRGGRTLVLVMMGGEL